MWIQQHLHIQLMRWQQRAVRIPLSGKHCSLQELVMHVIEHAGLREEAEKRGLESSIDVKLCPLEKINNKKNNFF